METTQHNINSTLELTNVKKKIQNHQHRSPYPYLKQVFVSLGLFNSFWSSVATFSQSGSNLSSNENTSSLRPTYFLSRSPVFSPFALSTSINDICAKEPSADLNMMMCISSELLAVCIEDEVNAIALCTPSCPYEIGEFVLVENSADSCSVIECAPES
eukprot:snap_masked-scaffold_75-processed-gene-0.51-mRNA-1 protein AED:1.00 eAED:1.00 QI:0/-1/0/0/-1/1/1/0/157